MIISDTSALVLNWTSQDVWQTKQAKGYFNGLDLSAADTLLELFDEAEQHVHTQAVSNRKFFMRKCAVEFLQHCRENKAKGQVIILAAGLAPLSVEIASLFPECSVFDVDKYLMPEKERYLNGKCPNIRFISCDITKTELLSEGLRKSGWDDHQPRLLIMEGITYYLDEKDLSASSCYFQTINARLPATLD
jgi:O-methyltransferase involved in polyketide biosynthesis